MKHIHLSKRWQFQQGRPSTFQLIGNDDKIRSICTEVEPVMNYIVRVKSPSKLGAILVIENKAEANAAKDAYNSEAEHTSAEIIPIPVLPENHFCVKQFPGEYPLEIYSGVDLTNRALAFLESNDVSFAVNSESTARILDKDTDFVLGLGTVIALMEVGECVVFERVDAKNVHWIVIYRWTEQGMVDECISVAEWQARKHLIDTKRRSKELANL